MKPSSDTIRKLFLGQCLRKNRKEEQKGGSATVPSEPGEPSKYCGRGPESEQMRSKGEKRP